MLNIYRHHFVDKQETKNNSASSLDSKLPTGGKHTCAHMDKHTEQTCMRTCAFVQACADEIWPAEFLYGEHEAGLVIQQGFFFVLGFF